MLEICLNSLETETMDVMRENKEMKNEREKEREHEKKMWDWFVVFMTEWRKRRAKKKPNK